MFDSFRSIFGGVTVKETATEIIVSGVRAYDIVRDMNKYWKTTKITANMFNDVSRGSFRFYKFFAPEIMYMLDGIMQYRSRYTSVKAIAAIKQAMFENTWLSSTKFTDENSVPGRLDFRRLSNMTFTPKEYQSEYFKDYSYRLDRYNLNGDLMAVGAGLGKTFLGSAIAEMLSADLIIVFSPKNVLSTVWLESIPEMFKTKQSIWSTIHNKPYNGERWIVTSYEQIGKVIEILRNPKVIQGKIVATILDESHNMNDPNSQRSQQYQLAVKLSGSRNNIMGSGTPVKALGAEIITLLRVVDPMFTPQVEERFRKIYGKEASKGLDIIQHRLGLVSFKVEKKELAVQPPIMRPYPIKIPNGERFTLPEIKKDMEKFINERWVYYKQRRPQDDKFWNECITIHKAALKSSTAQKEFSEYLRLVELVKKTPDPRYIGEEIKETNRYEKMVFEPTLPRAMIHGFRDVKSVIKYTALKIQGECLGRVLGGKRIEAHVAMVPYVDWIGIVESTEKKTIMFTSFVEALTESEKHCIKLGLKPLAVYGKTTNELASMVKRFETDSNLNPLVATYASLSTGVRLVMADTMILLNSPFRAYILEQAISRIYRMGQDSQTYVYQGTLDTGDVPNISTRSADILAWSQEQVSQIMGIKSPFQEGEVYANEEIQDLLVENNLDENKVLHRILQKAFENYDIDIPEGQFIPSKPKSIVPVYLQ